MACACAEYETLNQYYFTELGSALEMCCKIVQDYGLIPNKTWGLAWDFPGIRNKWNDHNCGDVVGGINTPNCPGKEHYKLNVLICCICIPCNMSNIITTKRVLK